MASQAGCGHSACKNSSPTGPTCTLPLMPVVVQAQPPVSWEERSVPERSPVVPAARWKGLHSRECASMQPTAKRAAHLAWEAARRLRRRAVAPPAAERPGARQPATAAAAARAQPWRAGPGWERAWRRQAAQGRQACRAVEGSWSGGAVHWLSCRPWQHRRCPAPGRGQRSTRGNLCLWGSGWHHGPRWHTGGRHHHLWGRRQARRQGGGDRRGCTLRDRCRDRWRRRRRQSGLHGGRFHRRRRERSCRSRWRLCSRRSRGGGSWQRHKSVCSEGGGVAEPRVRGQAGGSGQHQLPFSVCWRAHL